jgi:beta-lactam-binding protein with PASTA domain
MNETRYWIKLLAASGLAGILVFYFFLNLAVKGGKVLMPDLRGINRQAAQHRLDTLGLNLVVREERFSPEAYGAVLEQDIEPGATIKRGRSVELILSKGTKIVAVPSLKGMASLRQAALLLEQNGLEPGIQDQVHDALPKDTVLAQAPEPGTDVARGSTVSLLASLGPAPKAWVMPDLTKLDAAAARNLARAMGLILRKVTEKNLPAAAPGAVLAQSLSAGARVEEQSELNLVVASGVASVETARLVNIQYEVPDDVYAERRVLVTVIDSLGQRAVYNAMAKPADSIKVEARVHGKASYRVKLAGEDVEEKELP